MKKFKLFLITFLLTIFCLQINASATSTFYMPPSNVATGDYIVINNESVSEKSSGETIGSSNSSTGEFYQQNLPDKDGKFQIDINPSTAFNNFINGSSEIFFKSLNLDIKEDYAVGNSKYFWTANFEKNMYVNTQFTLGYKGTYCDVWIGDKSLSKNNVSKIGIEYDNNIYNKITENFGNCTDIDNNKKLNILCYDIQDGFNDSGSYVAGYFNPQDLELNNSLPADSRCSNEGETLYIDTYPLMYYNKDFIYESDSYDTIAHEFQHLINYSRNCKYENSNSMPTWIDEGLSGAASQVYSGKALKNRIDYYNSSLDITNGHSLINWNNNNSLPNYSLSYLFFQYLRIQCGQGNKIFKELIQDTTNNEKSIENLIHKYINKNMSLGKFTTNFRMALFLNQSKGLYGFENEPGFSTIKTNICTNYTNKLLNSGESIIVKSDYTKSFLIPTNKGKNINYLGTYDIYKREDVNRDGIVSLLDMAFLSDNYNISTTTSNWYCDPNRDGIFDIYDLVKVASYF